MPPPDRPTTIPFYSLRLRHLVSPKAALIISCGACRRVGRLDPVALLSAKGLDWGVRDLERVLRCQECGRRGFANVSVEWL